MAKKILVADDSQIIQKAIRIAFAAKGIKFSRAFKPGDVLSKALESSPDLILLDNRMNRLGADDGYQICRELKQNPALKNTPVLFLSGRSYDSAEGIASGAIGNIDKPFESEKFVETIFGYLNSSDSLEELTEADMEVTSKPFAPSSIRPPMSFKETTAIPAYIPVDSASMLPPSDDETLVPHPFGSSQGSSPDLPVPPPVPFFKSEPSASVSAKEEQLTPPPLPSFGTKPASNFGTKPVPSFGTKPASNFGTKPVSNIDFSAGSKTPAPLTFANVGTATIEPPKPRIQTPIIPEPSNEPQGFSTNQFASPEPAVMEEEVLEEGEVTQAGSDAYIDSVQEEEVFQDEMELEMEPPVFIETPPPLAVEASQEAEEEPASSPSFSSAPAPAPASSPSFSSAPAPAPASSPSFSSAPAPAPAPASFSSAPALDPMLRTLETPSFALSPETDYLAAALQESQHQSFRFLAAEAIQADQLNQLAQSIRK